MDLSWLGAEQARDMIASGDVSAVEVTHALLDRIEAVDAPGTPSALRSVLAIHPEALAQAARVDQGLVEGPLAGVPILIKDNVDCVGLPGTAGSLALVGRTVSVDAPLVARLREAGAVILGATNLSEWANIRSGGSTSGWSGVGGLVRNPWRHSHSSGGSSSGSGAAVAAGLAPLAVGTETDGSITCPASLNGVVGIKPTVGTVSTDRVIPISSSQDSPGSLARSLADATLMLDVLSGRTEFRDAVGQSTQGLRVGLVESWFTGHAGSDALIEATVPMFANAGMQVSRLSVPTPEGLHAAEFHVLLAELHDLLGSYLNNYADVGVRSLADIVQFNREHADLELQHFGQEFFEQALELGGMKTQAYLDAREQCLALGHAAMSEALEGVDLLISPAYATAWESNLVTGDKPVGGACTSIPAVLGWPIVTIPAGLVNGLPVGLALTGRSGTEAMLIAAAAQIERELDLQLRPTLAG